MRLFQRDTRNMALTEEGRLFLERCRRIFEEIDAAEVEVTKSASVPSGRLRVSLPLGGVFFMPTIWEFMRENPAVLLDLDFSDRFVDVIGEGFDVVIRTGPSKDSGLIRRSLGEFSGRLVASPDYLASRGRPHAPAHLIGHQCLRQRSPATGKLHDWALRGSDGGVPPIIPETMSASTIAPLIELAEPGAGIAFMPPFAVARQIADGRLVPLLSKFVHRSGELAALWPTSGQLRQRYALSSITSRSISISND